MQPPSFGTADIVSLLKVLPLSLAVLLSVLSLRFEDNWTSFVSRFVDDPDAINSEYMFYTVYIFDHRETKYSLIISFFYAGTILLLTFLESLSDNPDNRLVLPIVAFFALATLSCAVVDTWFSPERGRTPNSYHIYYYGEEEEIDNNIEDNYCHRLLPVRLDRQLTPKRITVFVELLLIAQILSFDYLAGNGAIVVTAGAIFLTIVAGFFVFPGKIFYPILGDGIN